MFLPSVLEGQIFTVNKQSFFRTLLIVPLNLAAMYPKLAPVLCISIPLKNRAIVVRHFELQITLPLNGKGLDTVKILILRYTIN